MNFLNLKRKRNYSNYNNPNDNNKSFNNNKSLNNKSNTQNTTTQNTTKPHTTPTFIIPTHTSTPPPKSHIISLSNFSSSNLEDKLLSSTFRLLNERFYTTSSADSFKYFTSNTEDFEIYHKGFRNQASQWPVNPNYTIIKELSKPKYADYTIADFGCGEALISQKLNKKVKKNTLI